MLEVMGIVNAVNAITDGALNSLFLILLLAAAGVLWLVVHFLQKGGEWLEDKTLSEEQKREKAEREAKEHAQQKAREDARSAKMAAVWDERIDKTSRLVRAVGNAGKSSLKTFVDRHAPENETAPRENITAISDNAAKDKPQSQQRQQTGQEGEKKTYKAMQQAKEEADWEETKAVIAENSARLFRAVGNAGAASLKAFVDKHAPEDEATNNTTAAGNATKDKKD